MAGILARAESDPTRTGLDSSASEKVLLAVTVTAAADERAVDNPKDGIRVGL
jgi:hypothetical protein